MEPITASDKLGLAISPAAAYCFADAGGFSRRCFRCYTTVREARHADVRLILQIVDGRRYAWYLGYESDGCI